GSVGAHQARRAPQGVFRGDGGAGAARDGRGGAAGQKESRRGGAAGPAASPRRRGGEEGREGRGSTGARHRGRGKTGRDAARANPRTDAASAGRAEATAAATAPDLHAPAHRAPALRPASTVGTKMAPPAPAPASGHSASASPRP